MQARNKGIYQKDMKQKIRKYTKKNNTTDMPNYIILASDGITDSTRVLTLLSIVILISSFFVSYAFCTLLIATSGILLMSAAVSAALRIAASSSRLGVALISPTMSCEMQQEWRGEELHPISTLESAGHSASLLLRLHLMCWLSGTYLSFLARTNLGVFCS